MSLSSQLEMFKQYIQKLKGNIGQEAAMNRITNSVFLVSAGTNDFLVNYFTFPMRRLQYDVPAYGNKLVKLASNFLQVQNLHHFLLLFLSRVLISFI